MTRVEFHGRVLPAGQFISISALTRKFTGDDGLSASLTITIVESSLKVICETSSLDSQSFTQLYNGSMRLARAVVDLAAFHEGLALTVILEEFVDEAGETQKIILRDPALRGINTAYYPSTDVHWALSLVLTEKDVGRMLHDLVQANAFPDDGARNSFRAIEAVRHCLVPGHKDKARAAAWGVLRDVLNVDEEYIDYVGTLAKNPRHGKVEEIPGPQRQECVRRAWVIVSRFLEYRRRGSAPLPESAFPILRN